MTTIVPPQNESDSDSEDEPISDWENYRRIQIFLNVPSWKCPKCGLTNHGRNKRCAWQVCGTLRTQENPDEKTNSNRS